MIHQHQHRRGFSRSRTTSRPSLAWLLLASLFTFPLSGCGEAAPPEHAEAPAPPPLEGQARRVRERDAAAIRVEGEPITEKNLKTLSALDGLRRLLLNQTNVTDRGLSRLKHLPNLRILRIEGGEVTDTGLDHVAQMPALRHLILVDLPITDAGLSKLHGMEQLESLYLFGSRATASGFRELRRARPNLHVHW